MLTKLMFCHWVLGRTQSKPWGIKKDSVPYMIEVVLTILTADKGVAMVVLDKEDYINKAKELLNTPSYKEIPKDPTNKIKAQLITKLRRIKKDRKLDEATYRTMYPTGCIPPKFYGLPKIHKTGTPLRPIVSSRGPVTYGVAKVLSKVIQPLVGKSSHHIQSTSDFVSKAKGFILQLENASHLMMSLHFLLQFQ